jgi:hypothetical protein
VRLKPSRCGVASKAPKEPAALRDFDRVYVRFGSGADISRHLAYVRFTPESGHRELASICLLCAKSGHNAVQQN